MILEVLIIFSLLSARVLSSKLEVSHEWKYAEFDWDGFTGDKSSAYDPSAVVLYDVDFAKDGRIFVTAVRDVGVPASVMTVTDAMGDGGPLLKPYPNWDWYKLGDCDGITSVYRVMIDSCNYIWVLDAGKVGSTTICQPQLLTFDLATNELIFRKKIPDSVTKNGSALLITPLVEPYANCNNFNVYMADSDAYGIVAYRSESDTFKRVESELFKPDRTGTTITIEGESFDIQDGPIGLAMATVDYLDEKFLIYTVLAAFRINALVAHDLFKNSPRGRPFVLIADLASQSAAIAISSPQRDSSQVVFFSQLQSTEILCFNTLSFHWQTVASDPETLQFPSGMKIHRYGGHDEIKIFTNRYQKVAAGTFTTNETNFRILRGNVDQMIEGSKCEAKHK